MKIISSLLLLILLLPTASMAQVDQSLDGLNTTANQAGFQTEESFAESETNLMRLVGGIINTILSFTGVIFLVIMVAAGEMWLTAGGNSDQVDKARGLIFNAVIGLLIVFASFIATNFAVPYILTFTGVS